MVRISRMQPKKKHRVKMDQTWTAPVSNCAPPPNKPLKLSIGRGRPLAA
jgi:hypothetical protein